jgi:acetylornithine deacetylase
MELKERFLDTALIQLLKNLIEIDSTTGKEFRIAEWLIRYLDGAGFRTSRQPLPDGRFNVFAACGEPKMVFSSHLDTVPPYVPYSEDEKNVYGRGACDAKGVMAAQIRAGELLRLEGFVDFGLLFVAGEEYGSEGAKAANRVSNACRYLIGGEPTDNKLAVGSKGSVRIKVTAKGKAAHSAYPESGESAVLKLLDVLEALRKYSFPANPRLGPTTLNIGTISGGTRSNVVPDRAEAEIMIRTVTDSESVKAAVSSVIGNRAEWDVAFECDPAFFNTVEGIDSTAVSFTTDMPLLSNWGKPFLIGPGSILDAHVPDEKISKAELERGVGLYRRIAGALTSGELSAS